MYAIRSYYAIGHYDVNFCSIANLDPDWNPLLVPGIPPYPDPFNGQFLQVDIRITSYNVCYTKLLRY